MAVNYKIRLMSYVHKACIGREIGKYNSLGFQFYQKIAFEKNEQDIKLLQARLGNLIMMNKNTAMMNKNTALFNIDKNDPCFNALSKILNINISSTTFFGDDKEKIIGTIEKDKNGNKYLKEISTGRLFPILGYEIEKMELTANRGTAYVAIKINLMKHPGFSAANVVGAVDSLEPASINDVRNYIEKVNKNKINSLADDNAMLDDVVMTTPEDKLTLSEEVSLMEDIEILLNKLMKKNYSIYKNYKGIYDQLKSLSSLSQLDKNTLLNLRKEIEFKLLTGEDLKKYLEKELSSYLNSFMNNEEVEEQLDIYSLDVITNYFLNSRDDYQLQEQKSIIEKLAGLYTLVTKYNTNTDRVMIEESYFNELKKSILLYIDSLHKEGITDTEIDFDREYETSEILELIYNMNLSVIQNNNLKMKKKSKI